MAFRYGDFPCHRVVKHQGRINPGWPEQVDLLKEDGVTFKNEFCVDLKKHHWYYQFVYNKLIYNFQKNTIQLHILQLPQSLQ